MKISRKVFRTWSRRAFIWSMTLTVLTACGGGSSGTSGSQNSVPPSSVPTPTAPPSACSVPSAIEGGGLEKTFTGVVSGVSDSELQVSGVRFAVGSAKIYVDGSRASIADVKTGSAVVVAGTVDSATRTGCASEVFADADIVGAIDAVDLERRALIVVGQDVRVDADTVYGPDIEPAALGALRVGNRIRVSGASLGNAIVAKRIDRATGEQGYRLSGGIEDHDSARLTFRVRQVIVHYDQATLVGLPTGMPRDGALVRVTGTIVESSPGSTGGSTIVRPARVEYIDYGTPIFTLPAQAYVQTGADIQFKVASGEPVSWNVLRAGGEECDPLDCGVIDSTGRYFAPLVEHVAPGLLIRATSMQNPSRSTTTAVFVYGVVRAVAVHPSSVTLQSGQSQVFGARTETGSWVGDKAGVAWSVTGPGCAGVACGTIDELGSYTPPKVPPDPAVVTVRASLVTDPAKSGSATIYLGENPFNTRLEGHYAYQLVGFDSEGLLMVTGAFLADGKGHITSGVQHISGEFIRNARFGTTGSYSLDGDGRGSIGFNVPYHVGLPTVTVALPLSGASSASGGQMTSYIADQVLVGQIRRQDLTQHSAAAMSGDYAFGMEGSGHRGTHMIASGRFTLAGSRLEAGQIDAVDDGKSVAPSTLSGELVGTPTEHGEVYFSLNSTSLAGRFVAVAVSRDEWFVMQVDERNRWTVPALSGRVLRQAGGPFTKAHLNGNSVLCMAGTTAGPLLGLQSFNGSGGLTGEVAEHNLGAGAISRSVSGTYSVDENGSGRGSMTFTGVQGEMPFYLVDGGRAFVIDAGSRIGLLEKQQAGPFSSASLSGVYALGARPPAMNWAVRDASGILNVESLAAGARSVITGTTDGAVSGQRVSGDFAVATDGRVSLTLNRDFEPPFPVLFYLTSPSRGVGIPVQTRSRNSGCLVMER